MVVAVHRLLFIALFAALTTLPIVHAATADPVFAATCSASGRDAQGSFPDACLGTYPSACGASGDYLSCNDDTNVEQHDTQNGDFSGVQISSEDTSVTNCQSITAVELCYEWWETFSAGTQNCRIAVDANGGGSYTTASTNCPAGGANLGVTCIDVTSDESWTCSSFFGASGTRAEAFMEAEKDAGQGGPGTISYDVLFFNVTYQETDNTPPRITLDSPANDTWDLDGTVDFQYTPDDDQGFGSCSLYLDGSLNETNSSVVDEAQDTMTKSLADGTHNWYIECTDSSTNTNTSETRTVKVDTTGPVVNLEEPEDGNLSSTNDVTFTYNASDAQTTLASCELITNGTVRDSTTDPAGDTTLSFSISLSNGFYEWSVNCTDDNGFESSSASRTITIDSPTPSIVSDKGTYTLGETALLDGGNFDASSGITINYTLANGTTLTNTTTSDGGGDFNDTFPIGYGYPTGSYDVFAYKTTDVLQNASTSFTVNLPATTLAAGAAEYKQGAELALAGTDYPGGETVTITITFNDTSTAEVNATANSTGGFVAYYNLSYQAPLGLAGAEGVTDSYPHINASGTFTIIDRVARLETDQGLYGRDENVNMFGYNFTALGIATLTLYDNNTDDTSPDFPVNKTPDDTGYFTHLWNTGDACNGVYRLEAQDQNNTELNDTIYFEIEELIQTNQTSLPVAGAKAVGTTRQAVTVSNINTSNEQDESLSSNTKADWYYEINFTNSLNRDLQIQTVEYAFEHANSGTFDTPVLSYWNGTAYEQISCPDLNMNDGTDHTDVCDATSAFSTPESLDQASLRVTAAKTSGGGATWTVDFAQLNITAAYEPTCTYFNGTSGGGLAQNPPSVDATLLDDNFASPADELDLNAGTTKAIDCNITVTDGDGYTDVTIANATIHHESVTESAADDPRTHYTNGSCSFVNGAGNEANYTCGFAVEYYALNGTWTCTATVADDTDAAQGTDTAAMNPLYALNVSTTLIDYGEFELGQQSQEQQVNVSNIGNARINVTAYAYGISTGDGLSLDCTQNNVSVESERFALSQGVAYTSKNPVAASLTPLDLFIDPQTTAGSPPDNETYWQLEAPVDEDPQGDCAGTLVFQADS